MSCLCKQVLPSFFKMSLFRTSIQAQTHVYLKISQAQLRNNHNIPLGRAEKRNTIPTRDKYSTDLLPHKDYFTPDNTL